MEKFIKIAKEEENEKEKVTNEGSSANIENFGIFQEQN